MLINILPVISRTIDGLFVAETGKSIKGRATKQGLNFPCRVVLFERMTDRLIAQAYTNDQGEYEFNNLKDGFEFFVVAHDHKRQYNAVIQDNVVPK